MLSILWVIRTTETQATVTTSFSLVHGTKAIIPAEIGVHSSRAAYPDLELNSKHLKANLNVFEEAREDVTIHMAI